MIVLWAADNLRFPQAQRIAILPEERRDRDNLILYVVTASLDFEQKVTDFIQAQGTPPA
jgi:hypothetical protein